MTRAEDPTTLSFSVSNGFAEFLLFVGVIKEGEQLPVFRLIFPAASIGLQSRIAKLRVTALADGRRFGVEETPRMYEGPATRSVRRNKFRRRVE